MRMQPGIVSLNEENVELIKPATGLLFHSQVAGCDVDLDRGAGAHNRYIRCNRDLAHVQWPPDCLLKAIFEGSGLSGEEVAGSISQSQPPSSCQLDGNRVILVIRRTLWRKAQLVCGMSVVDDFRQFRSQVAGTSNGPSSRCCRHLRPEQRRAGQEVQ